MYQVISDEMLNYFASIKDFNNLIGEPINRYRPEYKSLKYLRQFFFERVRNEPDLDKFVDYYKWIDATLEAMLMQLVPASAQMSDGIDNVVESHILERNKYWSKFPTAEFNTPTPETGALGINHLLYNWQRGHRPISGDQSENCFWWKERAERDTNFQSPLNLNATGSQHQDATNDRLAIYTASVQVLERSYTTPYRYTVEKTRVIHGGINYGENKKYHFYRSANFPHGPIDSMHVPQNVLVVFNAGASDDVAEIKDCDENRVSVSQGGTELHFQNVSSSYAPIQKEKYTFGTHVGRLLTTGSYDDVKGAISVPFNLISASHDTSLPHVGGYNNQVQNRFKSGSQLVNLHNDGYGDLNEVPMQGPFTEKYVGGHQARHIRLNNYSEGRVGADGKTATNDIDGQYTRPEAWRLLLGGGPSEKGALGITGPDYGGPYPDQQRMRAWFFREETTKRPVNIRNILQTTASVNSVLSGVLQHGPIGNYEKTYQVVQTSGRSTNNFWFNDGQTELLPAKYISNNPKTTNLHTLVAVRPAIDHLSKNLRSRGNGFLAAPSSSADVGSEQYRNYVHLSNLYYPKAAVATSASAGNITVVELPNRTKQDAVIVERFSAPGGPEINSLGFLDIIAAEKSVYNALPYRNLSVRGSGSGEEEVYIEGTSGDVRPATMHVVDHLISKKPRGLRTLLSLHANFGGTDGTYGVVSDTGDYVEDPNFHKINRNRAVKIATGISDSYDDVYEYGTASIYDNAFVQHPIPQNDIQYSWISSSYQSGSLSGTAYGHAPRSGMVSGTGPTNKGMRAAIPFMSSSQPDYSGATHALPDSGIPVDFVGLNTLIYDPTGSVFNILSSSQPNAQGYLDSLAYRNVLISEIGTLGVPASATIECKTTDVENLHAGQITLFDNFGNDHTYTFDAYSAPNGGSSAPVVAIAGLSTEALLIQQLAQCITQSSTHGNTINVSGIGTDTITVTYASASTAPNGLLTRKNTRGSTTISKSLADSYLDIEPNYGFNGGEDPDFGAPGAPTPLIALNALLLHRQGPYGFSSWRQIRNQNHPLVRHMRNSNTVSIIEPNSKRVTTRAVNGYPGYSWGPEPKTMQGIYGSGDAVTRDREVLQYHEPAVLFHNPMTFESDLKNLELAEQGSAFDVDKKVTWKASYINQKGYFTNSKLNEKLRLTNDTTTSAVLLMEAFQKAQLTSEFRNFKYKEAVYPAKKNIYMERTRTRPTYQSIFWRDDMGDRIVNVPNTDDLVTHMGSDEALPAIGAPSTDSTAKAYMNSQGSLVLSQSTWPLDGRFQLNESFYTGSRAGTGLPSPTTFKSYVYTASGSSDTDGGRFPLTGSGTGELQNCFTTVHTACLSSSIQGSSGSGENSSQHNPVMYSITASALYNRKHILATGSSTLPWSSAFYKGKQPLHSIPGHLPQTIINFAGDAPWDAANQFGKKPFYDSYDDYVAELRVHGKEYSILPEYRMSDRMTDYLKNGVDPFNDVKLFTLTGAVSNTTSSQEDDFYKIYSHSDFMQYFGVTNTTASLKLNAAPVEFAVSCKGLLKLLPYDGFYPASRTLQIASLFSQSYGANIELSEVYGSTVTQVDSNRNSPASADASYWRSIITPLFAPGLLYNSIKSGIAVDFPVFTTGSPGWVASDSGSHGDMISYCIGNPTFHERLPFETLIEPNSNIAFKKIYDMEVHPSAAFWGGGAGGVTPTGSSGAYRSGQQVGYLETPQNGPHALWNGQGDSRYKLAMHNFLAETPEFFLENQTFTSFFSAPQSQWKVPDKTKSYKMRVKLRKSVSVTQYSSSVLIGNMTEDPASYRNYPQVVSGTETMVMYSRPSAFGPEVGGGFPDRVVGAGAQLNYVDGGLNGQNCGFFGDSRTGYNPAFTPAYYDGEAWADLEYNPGLYTDEGVPTLETLLSRITASYLRFAGPLTGSYVAEGGTDRSDIQSEDHEQWIYGLGGPKYYKSLSVTPTKGPMSGAYECNTNSNQVSSSINLFGSTKGLRDLLKYEGYSGTEEGQWVIQTKWETPMLNFIDNSGSDGSVAANVTPIDMPAIDDNHIAFPLHCSGGLHTRPIGMWHQYGRLPSGSEGIFMEIDDVPYEQRYLYPEATRTPIAGTPDVTGSLADLVGFSKTSQRLGRLAQSKTIREAVVAVPFVEANSGERKFFGLAKEQIDFVFGMNPPLEILNLSEPKQSVIDMVEKMQRYVFPPSMDFITYAGTVEPFSMYIFEFEHKLNQQDLLNIWQNLPPRIARAFDPDDPIDTDQIVKTRTISHTLEDGQLLNEIDDRLQWMVFKVKQKAQTNYYSKVVQDNYSLNVPDTVLRSELINLNIQQYSAGGAGAGGVTKGDPYTRSYNWPYDFFSLVELAKIDDEVTYSTVQTLAGRGVIKVPDGVTSLPPGAQAAFGQQQSQNAFEAVMAGAGSALVAQGGPGAMLESQGAQGSINVFERVADAAQPPMTNRAAAQAVVSERATTGAPPPAVQRSAPVVSSPAVSVKRIRNLKTDK